MKFIIDSRQKKRTGLFFIALIPNRELRIRIHKFKFDFQNRFESSKALNVYTHLTLKAPFICSYIKKEKLLHWFSEMPIQQNPFHLYLNGFGAFYNKYNPVVYVDTVMSMELMKLQKELMIGFNGILPANVHSVDRKFKPHITVAYRDITQEDFFRAWQEYKNKPFYDVFDVHSIYLLEHDTKDWNIIATHKLG